MENKNNLWAVILGISIILGFSSLGYLGGKSAVKIKEYERVVSVKGLATREVKADIVIWPIEFKEMANDLSTLYSSMEESKNKIKKFLVEKGIGEDEISFSSPNIEDKLEYGGTDVKFRYGGSQKVVIYTDKIDEVKVAKNKMEELLKAGVVTNQGYYSDTEYLFSGLNEIKPQMIEEATKNAREVAEKFAKDSNSSVGKIKTANQGQFTIYDRNESNKEIKIIRIVSTIEYYLVD